MTLPEIFIPRSRRGKNVSDDELMRRIRRGNSAAFRELYDRYKQQMFLYCFRTLNNRDAAKDIVQEVFIRVHSMSGSYEPGRNFQGWLHTIVRNLCLNHRRDEQPFVQFEEMDEEMSEQMILPLEDPAGFGEDVELRDLLAREVERLPQKYREALVLREYEGQSYEDIAKMLGITLANVKFRIFYAREILRERLGNRLEDYR